MIKILNKLLLLSLSSLLPLFVEAKGDEGLLVNLLKIGRKLQDPVVLEVERFGNFMEKIPAPEIHKDNEIDRLFSDFDIPVSIKIETADALARFIQNMKKGVELARSFPNSRRDEKECHAWMNFFDWGFSKAESDLAKLRQGNPTDDVLKVAYKNSSDYVLIGAQLAPAMSYCILPRGNGFGEMPGIRKLREKFEAGEIE